MQQADDILNRVKASAGCLSHWQLSRWAMGTTSVQEGQNFAVHVDGCADCARRWHDETSNHAAAQWVPLPEALRQPERRRWLGLSGWVSGLALAASVLLAAAAWMHGGAADHVRLKGATQLQMAVRHAGAVQEGTWPQPTVAGDQVRFKAPSGAPTWQRLEVRQGDAWVGLFTGEVEADGWVPVGLTVNAGPAQALQLIVCPTAPRVLPATGTLPPGCALHAAHL